MEIGDIVVNEYNNIGKLIEIHGNEAIVEVFNYGLQNDEDYCDIRLCRLATNEEKDKFK